LFFNNLDICHIESSVSQLSLFSLFSTISLLWTQFWVSVDTTWTPRWTPKLPPQRQDQVYQKRPFWCPRFPVIEQKLRSLLDSSIEPPSTPLRSLGIVPLPREEVRSIGPKPCDAFRADGRSLHRSDGS